MRRLSGPSAKTPRPIARGGHVGLVEEGLAQRCGRAATAYFVTQSRTSGKSVTGGVVVKQWLRRIEVRLGWD